MDKKILFAIATLVLLGAATIAAYEFWQSGHHNTETIQANNTPPPFPAPAPIAPPAATAAPAQPPLPPLAQSDSFVFDALAGVVANRTLLKIFHAEQIVHNIVVTIDNLPQQRVPVNVMPFSPPSGRFLAAGSADHLTISSRNANRYAAYVSIAEAVDAKKLVELYVRLYPLFQQSYKELGYPNDNFNDQLNDTLDDLLDTHDITGPIKLVQPRYFYLYADPDLEARSIGQKIMLRLGSKNLAIIKNKLSEIKQELALHSNELRTRNAD